MRTGGRKHTKHHRRPTSRKTTLGLHDDKLKATFATQSNFSNKHKNIEGRRNADWDIQTLRELHIISLSLNCDFC